MEFRVNRLLLLCVAGDLDTIVPDVIKPRSVSRRRYKCRVCAYTTTAVSHLERHIRKHTGERPYQCDHCSKTFKQQCHLVRHFKTLHTGEHPLSLRERLKVRYHDWAV
ncbi:hypothetical protein MRX96_037309 [Rhipicephalus microplus]